MKKIENPGLLSAMHELALRDIPENRERLYYELQKATLILPTPEVPEKAGLWVADGKTSIQILGMKDSNGVEVTPAFTDDEALRNWNPNTPSVAMNAKALFHLIVPLPVMEVVINPFDPIQKMIRPGGRVIRLEFEALAKGILPQIGPLTRTTRPTIGTKMSFANAPTAFPQEVLRRLDDVLVRFPEVQSAFLLTISYGGERPHRAIAIRPNGHLDEARQHLMLKMILEIVQLLLNKEESFDLVPLTTDEFYEDVVRVAPPFYGTGATQ
jgi:type III secretion system (T3SS) SseB-like protein